MKRDYIDTSNFTKEELIELAKLGILLKNNLKAGFPLNLLYHKTLTLLFDKDNPITRMSFESAMTSLGGSTHFLLNKINNNVGSLHDQAKLISRLSDIMVVCDQNINVIEQIAKDSDISVINGMSSSNNPVQELTDLITIIENLPKGKKLEDIKIVFVGDASKSCVSLMKLITKVGANFVQFAPNDCQFGEDLKQIANDNCATSGGSFLVTDDEKNIEGADFIYTDIWNGLSDISHEERINIINPKFFVNLEMVNRAGEKCKVLHSLPINHDEEISDEIINSERSLIFESIENNLAASRAVLVLLMNKHHEAVETCKRNLGE